MDKCYVYLPVYNGSRFLQETLESVLHQDYENYQVIVWDDCSSDCSSEMIRAYLKKYPKKIIYQKNKRNLGVGTTLHKCYQKYHDAAFFAQIGHDDIWTPKYLSGQIRALKSSGAVAAFGKTDYIDEKGNKIRAAHIFQPDILGRLKADELFLRLVHSNFLCAPASVVDLTKLDREEAAQFWGYNNERLQDCEFWLNLCLRGEFIYNQDAVMEYRLHQNNLSDVTKRVLQGKLEYATMLQRVLYSGRFYEFIEEQDDPFYFLDRLLDTLGGNFAYSNPLKLLVLNLCEQLLNMGYETDTIWRYLNWMYMDSGIIQKCRKNGRPLPGRILIMDAGIKDKDFIRALEKETDFQVCQNTGIFDPRALCVLREDGMEYLLNTAPYPYYFANAQMIVFAEEDHVKRLQQEFPHLLIVSEETAPEQLIRVLYSFVEDKTHIYRNGFFDMITSYTYPDTGYRRICVAVEEEVIRLVSLPDHRGSRLKVYSGLQEMKAALSDGQNVFLEDGRLAEKRIFIESDKAVFLKERVVINNVLYICTEVAADQDGNGIPLFKKLCYYNNGVVKGMPGSMEMEGMYAQKEFLLQQITNSFSYKLMMKCKSLLLKTGLFTPVRKLLLTCYRLVKHKPYGSSD